MLQLQLQLQVHNYNCNYNLCDYRDAYILVKGTIAVDETSAADAATNNTNKK